MAGEGLAAFLSLSADLGEYVEVATKEPKGLVASKTVIKGKGTLHRKHNQEEEDTDASKKSKGGK